LNARIIGVGQKWACDDGVGRAVVYELRKLNCQFDLVEIDDPSRLIELLCDGADPVVIVDAAMDGGPAGRVLLIESSRRGPGQPHLLSTHGIDVMQAIEMARLAHPEIVARRIFVIGVTIVEALGRGENLSAPVRAAVAHAAVQAIKLCTSA
jgi:hydrogenase maturation protease